MLLARVRSSPGRLRATQQQLAQDGELLRART